MWTKGEIYDLNAMQETIYSRNELVDQLSKLEQKKQNFEGDVLKLSTGRKTIKNIFKSATAMQLQAQNLKNNIEVIDRDINLYKKILNIIHIYLSEFAIPQFKEDKLKNYYKILAVMSGVKISESHLDVTFWTNVLNVVTQFGF